MPSSRSQAAYGGPSMSCLAVGVYRRLQISVRRGGEGNLRPRRPPREYLGEYTS